MGLQENLEHRHNVNIKSHPVKHVWPLLEASSTLPVLEHRPGQDSPWPWPFTVHTTVCVRVCGLALVSPMTAKAKGYSEPCAFLIHLQRYHFITQKSLLGVSQGLHPAAVGGGRLHSPPRGPPQHSRGPGALKHFRPHRAPGPITGKLSARNTPLLCRK